MVPVADSSKPGRTTPPEESLQREVGSVRESAGAPKTKIHLGTWQHGMFTPCMKDVNSPKQTHAWPIAYSPQSKGGAKVNLDRYLLTVNMELEVNTDGSDTFSTWTGTASPK